MDEAASRIRSSVERLVEHLAAKPPATHPDTPARAVWAGGLMARIEAPPGLAWHTDMPRALGGTESAPSPGWLFRAGAAACLLTTIAMHAAQRGVALRRLEVEAHSASDVRGMLGVPEGVPPGPQGFRMEVTIEADGAEEAQLQDLVAYADAHAPMSGALRRALDVRTGLRTAVAAA